MKIGSRMKSFCVLVMLMVFGLQTQVSAEMVSTQQLLAEQRLDSQRAEVSAFLARDEVQRQLMARGVDAVDAASRVAALTADELALLHAHIDELPAGEGILETVLFLLVIFILLDLAGVTNIFPGI